MISDVESVDDDEIYNLASKIVRLEKNKAEGILLYLYCITRQVGEFEEIRSLSTCPEYKKHIGELEEQLQRLQRHAEKKRVGIVSLTSINDTM